VSDGESGCLRNGRVCNLVFASTEQERVCVKWKSVGRECKWKEYGYSYECYAKEQLMQIRNRDIVSVYPECD
jgi:hypothetical protein